MILIAIVGIAVSVANKKNTAKAQKQRQAMQGRDATGPKPGSAQGAPNRTSPAKPSAAPSKFPPAGPSKRVTAAAQRTQQKPVAPSYGGTPKYTHVVTSTLEGGHTHTESSMTGEEACPPPKAVQAKHAEPAKAAPKTAGALLDFQANSVLQGVLYAQILGKPKALQRQ